MSWALLAQIIFSVCLSSSAQLLLKAGMSGAAVQAALEMKRGPVDLLFAVATSPFIVGGLGIFGVSVLVWLSVLSRVEVSQAYPAIALGIVVTALGGHFLFGEALSPARIAGVAVIVLGVLIVARS